MPQVPGHGPFDELHLADQLRSDPAALIGEAFRTASEIELPFTTVEALMTIGQIGAELRTFELAETAYQQAN